MALIICFCFALFLQGTLGELFCEEIPAGMCSLSVSSAGKRCSLETSDQTGEIQCRTSQVFVNGIREHIETDECVDACGADRNAMGISSDSLLEPQFIAKLCSKRCLNNCPNIVDLYSNLALGEGVFLPELCMAQETSPRREMYDLRSSSIAAAPFSAWASGQLSAVADGPTSAAPAHADEFGSNQIFAAAFGPTSSIAAAPFEFN